MKQTVFEGAPQSGTQKQLFEKELQRENLSQNLKELRTLRVALTNPDQKKLFAQHINQNSQENPQKLDKREKPNLRANSIDWHIEKRLAPTNDEQHPSTIEYMNYIRKRSVHDMGFPNVIRVSSKMDKESVYSLRKQLRRCFIRHDEFKPELDSFMAQKLYKGVYKTNDQECEDKVYQPLSEFITNNGNYKNLHMQMHEKVTAINSRKLEQQHMKQKMYEEYLASLSGKSPREICKQVFRQTLLQGSDPYIKRHMDFQKQLDLNDYIQSKIEDLEPSKDGSLDLIIKNVEQMIVKGFTFQKVEQTIPQIGIDFHRRRPSKQLSEESQKILSIKSSLMIIREANGYSVNASPIKQVDSAQQMHDIPSTFSLQLPQLQLSQDQPVNGEQFQQIPKSAAGNRPQQLNDIEYSDVDKDIEETKQLERTSTANFPTAQSEADQPIKQATHQYQQNLKPPEAIQIIQSIKKIDLSKIKHRGQQNMQLTALTTKNPFQQASERRKSHLHSPSYSSVGSYSTAINSNRHPNNKTMLSNQIQFKKQAYDTSITFSANQGQFTSNHSVEKSKRLTPLPISANRFQQTMGSFKVNEQSILTQDNSETTSLMNSTARDQFLTRRANSVLKPLKLFNDNQNDLRTVLADCLDSINTSKVDFNQKVIDQQFTDHKNHIDDTYQSLLFYEHQLQLHIDQPCAVVNELQPFDEIQKRRLMHIKDDTDNLTGRDAIKNSLSSHEKKIVYDIIMQNAQDKNRQLWKPDATEFPGFMKAIFKKYESEQIELPE